MNQHMNVVWHQAPRSQIVLLPTELAETRLAKLRNVRPSQPALATPLIEVGLQLLASFALLFDLEQCRPFSEELFGECIGQMVSDELGQAGRVPVRQIARARASLESLCADRTGSPS